MQRRHIIYLISADQTKLLMVFNIVNLRSLEITITIPFRLKKMYANLL